MAMKKNVFAIVVSVFIGILLLSMIGKKLLTSNYPVSVTQQLEIMTSSEISYSLYDLAKALKINDPDVLLVDIRTEEEYAQGHLPNAINIPIELLFHKDNAEIISGRESLTKVLYGNSEAQAIKANSLLILNGHNKFKILNGGYQYANQFVVATPTPSFFHYSDEKMKYYYPRLMPAGSSSNYSATKEEVKVEVMAPRGGC
jgi:rhodanese-related sulfurtransferase